MTPEKWKELKSIFDRAVELSTGERRIFLSELHDADLRSELGKMLETDQVDLYEFSPAKVVADDSPEPPLNIGRFKIVREIGRGGMGAVYLAERDDGEFAQKAALKVIKRGMDSDEIVGRFRSERQILAGLQHPNIARLLDGGTTREGQPYYAMEYIDGQPIDVYIREQEWNVRETLETFRKVCSAVTHAHRNLVVHRDLKPSNILVTDDGEPKLLDFGIAKILAPHDGLDTATQFGMMTPVYASPEQIRGGRITTASDVYSLGVILYELLTGSRPYETEGKPFTEAIEIVCGRQPRRPSETVGKAKSAEVGNGDSGSGRGPQLKGDLDNITLKALQKEPERRYQSVHELSEDIRRHLEGLPVTARVDSAGYRLRKFVKRNKIFVVSGTLVFFSMCTGVAVSLWQANRAEHQRMFAEKRFAEVRQLANNVVFKYHDAIAELPGSTGVRELLVSDALHYLDALAADSAGDRELQKELALAYLKLADAQGKIYSANIGDTEGSIESYRKAIGLLESITAADPQDVGAKRELVKAYDSLAFLLTRAGGGAEVRELVDKALVVHSSGPMEDVDKIQLVDLLIRVGDASNGFENNLAEHMKALPIAKELVDADPGNVEKLRAMVRVHQRISTDLQRLGDQAKEAGHPEKAESLFGRSLAHARLMFDGTQQIYKIEPGKPANVRYVALASINLGEALGRAGEHSEGVRLLGDAERITSENLRVDPKNSEARFDLMAVHETLGTLQKDAGETAAAAESFEKALALGEEISLTDPKNSEVKLMIAQYRKILQLLREGK